MIHPNDPGHPAVLFAKLPERLDDSERRRKYDEPLTAAIRVAGIDASLRGFSQPGGDGRVAWVGIEVTLGTTRDAAFVAERLTDLGAPAATVIEIETETASVELSLAEVAWR